MSKVIKSGRLFRVPPLLGQPMAASHALLAPAPDPTPAPSGTAPSLPQPVVMADPGDTLPSGSRKLLVVMQFYPGDKSMALAVSRLVADIELSVCPWADWAFCARFDCTHDMPTVAYMRTKFTNVHLLQSSRRKTGWPQGPNAMAQDIFKTVHEKTKTGAWKYDAVLFAEADCLPLRRTWIKELWMDWHSGTQLVLGAWFGPGNVSSGAHINGNLLFSPQLTQLLPRIWQSSSVPASAWDSYFFPQWARYARASRLIYSDYRLGTPNRPWPGCAALWQSKCHRDAGNPLRNVPLQPCWLHGCKSPEGVRCVRQKFNLL